MPTDEYRGERSKRLPAFHPWIPASPWRSPLVFIHYYHSWEPDCPQNFGMIYYTSADWCCVPRWTPHRPGIRRHSARAYYTAVQHLHPDHVPSSSHAKMIFQAFAPGRTHCYCTELSTFPSRCRTAALVCPRGVTYIRTVTALFRWRLLFELLLPWQPVSSNNAASKVVTPGNCKRGTRPRANRRWLSLLQ
jgi:hypothetical protein